MGYPPAGFFNGVFVPPGLVFAQSAVGAAYNTSTTATAVNGTLANTRLYGSGTAGTFDGGTYGTSFNLNKKGRILRVCASGTIANTSTPNLTMAIKLGTNVLSTTGVQATAAITGTVAWRIESTSVVTTAGSSGVVISNGLFMYYTTAPVLVQWQMTNTVSGTGLSIDLTKAYAITLNATWGSNSASNTLTVNEFSVFIDY